jgi:hypothetical protein
VERGQSLHPLQFLKKPFALAKGFFIERVMR